MSIDLSKVAYISMSGAQAQGQKLVVIAENLSNIQSIGYRAQVTHFIQNPLPNSPFSHVLVNTQYSNFRTGAMQETGKTLDLSLEHPKDFFVVLAGDGSEGFTRNGAFKIDENGQLKTLENQPVLGSGGPISIPPNSKISISSDGTITATDIDSPALVKNIGKIRVVSVEDFKSIVRHDDGLFRAVNNNQPPVNDNPVIKQGFLENSNVSAPQELTDMISNARVFEYNMRIIHEITQNEQSANQLLAMSHN